MNFKHASEAQLKALFESLLRLSVDEDKAAVTRGIRQEGLSIPDLFRLAELCSAALQRQLDALGEELEESMLEGHRGSREEAEALLLRLGVASRKGVSSSERPT
jgi:hypothetical protein